LSQLSTKVQGPGDLGHARVGVIEGTSAEDYCRDNNISPVRIADLNQALQRVEEGQLDALVYDAGIMQYEIRNSFAGRILVLPYRMQSSAYGFVVPEESPLKEPMGQSMLRILAQPEWRELVEGYLGRE
jgi:polar amino acid transport system substrate-binding protein